MSSANIICECVLVGAAMSSLKQVATHKPPNAGAWRVAFFMIAAASAIGASKYAGYTAVAPLHETLSGIANFLGGCCIALASNQSINLFPIRELNATIMFGVFCGLQVVILLLPLDPRVQIIKEAVPLICMIIITLLGFFSLLFDKLEGVRKSKARWMLLGILLFAVADNLLKKFGLLPRVYGIEIVDVFHILVAWAMYCFGNVVYPRAMVPKVKK